MKVRVSMADLKKSVDWLMVNSLDSHIDVAVQDGKFYINCMDRHQTSVEIKIYQDGTMMPKIKKETNL